MRISNPGSPGLAEAAPTATAPLRADPARGPAAIEAAERTLAQATEHLRSLQHPDGHWRGLLETNVTMDAEDMLLRSYHGHRTPEDLGPSDRARADGYRAGIGENIVEQRYSVQEALDAWLGSPAHRRNILDPGIREVGLGLALGGGYDAAPGGYRVVWVQSFGRGE